MIFNREEQHLMLEGSVLSKEDVKRLVACYTEEASGFLYELYRFLEEWFSDSPYLTVKTSGFGFLLMVAAPTLPVSQYEFFAEASAAVPGNQVFPF